MNHNSVTSSSILDIDVWLRKSSSYWLSSCRRYVWDCWFFISLCVFTGMCGFKFIFYIYGLWSRLLSVSALWIALRKSFRVIVGAWNRKVRRASHGSETKKLVSHLTMLLVNQWIRLASVLYFFITLMLILGLWSNLEFTFAGSAFPSCWFTNGRELYGWIQQLCIFLRAGIFL
jgi:hypothetical protein